MFLGNTSSSEISKTVFILIPVNLLGPLIVIEIGPKGLFLNFLGVPPLIVKYIDS